MKRLIFALAMMLMIPLSVEASEKEPELKKVDFTCYVTRGTTYSGCQTRKGIAASSKELIGYTAVVYLIDEDGNPSEILAYYEILDRIGTKWGNSGTVDDPHVLDVWCESMEEAKSLMKLTGGKVLVQLVKAEG